MVRKSRCIFFSKAIYIIWAVLERSFISQGRKELLTPPLLDHLCGHSDCLRVGFQCFAYVPACADLCTFLWPPPFFPHEGGVYSMAHLGKYKKKQFATALILAQKHHLTMHPKLLESLNHPGPRADECHSKESQRNEGIPQKAYHGDSLRGCITFTK